MLHYAPTPALQDWAKNVTKSKSVLLRVCGTRFSKDSGETAESDKNDRFCHAGFGKGLLFKMRDGKALMTSHRFEPSLFAHDTYSKPCYEFQL
jgi:hypothetical protein